MLNFNIQNQTITRTDNFAVVSDSKNYLKATFNFSDEWSGAITAVFDYGGKAYCVILPEDNTCFVPWEVIKPPYFTVSLFCGDLITANVVSVDVEKSGYQEGKIPAPPTPDVYAQILNSAKAPYIGDNGNWYQWDVDAKAFFDTGVRAEGPRGEKGDTGAQGENGSDGYTPKRGVDYWTEEDKTEIVNDVLVALPAEFVNDVLAALPIAEEAEF